MKRTVIINPIKISEKTGIYSFQFSEKTETEFGNFMFKYSELSDAVLKDDFQRIMRALQNILNRGALERYFRPESKMSNGVSAIPLDKCTFRLYCLRLSDEILIIGNGGIKHTRTYNEDPELRGYIADLEQLDQAIKKLTVTGVLEIRGTHIIPKENFIIEL